MADKKQMEGEVFYPSEEVVAQARLKDWDALAEKANKDLQGFWADEARELEWYKPWDKVRTIRTSHSSSGLSAQKQISSTTPLTVISRRIARINSRSFGKAKTARSTVPFHITP